MKRGDKAVRAAVAALGWGLVIVALAAATALRTSVLRAAAHTAEMTIVANKTASGGFAFNGYQRGGMTITVPVAWQVTIHFENTDSIAHSLGVLPSGAHQQVAPPSAPAFVGATTTNFAAGLPKGPRQTVTFEATKPGTYEFVCGVPGHAVSGQWDVLVVSASADAPNVTPPGAATITEK